MSRPQPLPYRTTNWHDYNASLSKRGSLLIWFDPETHWLAAPTGKRGRQPVFTDAAIHLRRIRKQSGRLFSRRMA